MTYQKCRCCIYRCNCCSGRYTLCRCSDCENHYDEFRPAENIIYCPLDGKEIDAEIKDCLSCKNSFSEERQDGDVLHCIIANGKIVEDNGHCNEWNGD